MQPVFIAWAAIGPHGLGVYITIVPKQKGHMKSYFLLYLAAKASFPTIADFDVDFFFSNS